jgi:hypothetical protein
MPAPAHSNGGPDMCTRSVVRFRCKKRREEYLRAQPEKAGETR